MIILDRYEGEYAVIEVDKHMINIDKSLLEENIKEGDVLILKEGRYYKDQKATNARKRDMTARFSKLWEE